MRLVLQEKLAQHLFPIRLTGVAHCGKGEDRKWTLKVQFAKPTIPQTVSNVNLNALSNTCIAPMEPMAEAKLDHLLSSLPRNFKILARPIFQFGRLDSKNNSSSGGIPLCC